MVPSLLLFIPLVSGDGGRHGPLPPIIALMTEILKLRGVFSVYAHHNPVLLVLQIHSLKPPKEGIFSNSLPFCSTAN